MNIYKSFLKKQILHYLCGSGVAVIAGGGLLMGATLEISEAEYGRLILNLCFSFVIMVFAELRQFKKHIEPIRLAFIEAEPSLEMLRSAYLRTHRLPMLAVKRIFGPHLLGLSVPSSLAAVWMIHSGLLHLPYSYIGLGLIGAVLIASMHALIEFYLTEAAIPVLVRHFREEALTRHKVDFSLEEHSYVSIGPKFLISCTLIGTFPLFLFSVMTQVRLGSLSGASMRTYWAWAGLVVMLGILFSMIAALLLTRSVQRPIQQLYAAMNEVKDGRLLQLQNHYSDEFSRLVAGFNMMTKGLQVRERQNRQMLDSLFTTLAVALDARDSYTAGHSVRVAEYSVIIGQLSGMRGQELDNLHKSALLHDIGKIGVRDSVLFKEGKLTDEEFGQIKSHPVLGVNILGQIEPQEKIAPYLGGVRSHHERYDGKGYPDGLSGDGIPLFGRIIAVADAYDAMTSDRPYRKGIAHEQALAILEKGRGTQWDPEFAALFLSYFGKICGTRGEGYPEKTG
ncbi:HD-GYP domain-containing protein [Paenibacillus rhizophilus]|uniref:HD-GYP domain-containing protein n=1 Tax=Paenibacillus rhizophilus TaxID=1850366 RepID=A0A3N9P034_9BACL|nr:HD-GYP domain-containing protein [Paenibacillus rhizophilus]RQW08610.1 HD-GYP domain-containing protein [Paenibacillus rhizophilus]